MPVFKTQRTALCQEEIKFSIISTMFYIALEVLGFAVRI